MKQVYHKLLVYQQYQLDAIEHSIPRGIYQTIDWTIPHIMITGQRGIGKSTLLLQHLRDSGQGFYFSADHSLIASV
jgi:predicted AAA+ superfamily ATPase